MPNSQHNPLFSAEAVSSYLTRVLPSSQLSFKPVDEEHEPLVLLRTDHIAAGFGFSNGDVVRSYEVAYRGFKTLFNAQNGLWDALDLAFVFCVHPSFSNLDQFCSSVETDVYFCRKFVVPVTRSLDSSLARLPFLPLAPVEARTLRPATAQTFLQQCGVSSVLSRYIVVQRERGAEKIVEDCVQGEFGAPATVSGANPPPIPESDGGREIVRLEEITIKNFRAYRKSQTFAIGADVTVLYGPNGFGKTSFFDAVDFAVTGGIGRLETSSDAHFSKMARHLDSGSEDAITTLSLRSNDVSRKIVRNVKSRKDALLDGRPADRKTILSELTGREIPVTDRVENFVDLFRATHLFNQELQELTKDFQEDCCLPAEIVSRMLAFQDYSNALSKAAKVCDVLKEIIRISEAEIIELTNEIGDGIRELNRLNPASSTSIETGLLDARLEDLKLKLQDTGLELGPARPELTTIRQWRAFIEGKLGESNSQRTRLSELARELANLPRTRTELADAEAQIREKEQVLATTEQARTSSEAVLQLLERIVPELTSKLNSFNAENRLFEWYRLTRPTYLAITNKHRLVGEELRQIRSDIEQLRLADQKAANDVLAVEDRLNHVNEGFNLRRKEIDGLRKLLELLPLWQTSQNSLGAIAESESALQRSRETLQNEERSLVQQLTPLSEDEQRLARQVEEIDQTQSAFRALLLQLQGHITSGMCPLCGEDHGTQHDLLDRVQNQLRGDPASRQRADLAETREKIKRLRETLAENRTKQESAQSQLSSLKQSRSSCEADIVTFNNAALESGIVVERPDQKVEDVLHARILSVQNELDKLQEEIRGLSNALEPARRNASSAKNLLNAKLADEAAKKEAFAQTERDLDIIRNDQRWARLALDSAEEQVFSDEKHVVEQAVSVKVELTTKQSQLEQKKSEIAAWRREAITLRNQLQALRNHIANLHRRITELTAKLEEANLPAETTDENVLTLVGQQTRGHEVLVGLRESASNLELALDAVTTAAALSTLRQTIRNKEKAVDQAKQKRDRHKPWLDYFLAISRLLSSQQNRAIASFTEEYGPRTSVIQRRLRPVYGFDDIEIHSRESRIQVRVKRHGEELRPTDYFSQSQQQTLLLGLFLTACISQTWSGFSPVFMDDPVTHFDDLNTYAFLDLIVGLLESDSSKRQFIISTCDEKLLQLARQKFRHLGKRAIFYRFEAIGEDGPIVNRING